MSNNDDFIPKDYCDISSSIVESIKTDTDIVITKNSPWLRVAVSRAYYSAFLSLRKEFEADTELKSILTNSKDEHQIIIDKLYTLPGRMKKHANALKNLRKNRNHCDYHLPPKFEIDFGLAEVSSISAETLILNSQYIINNLPKENIK